MGRWGQNLEQGRNQYFLKAGVVMKKKGHMYIVSKIFEIWTL